MLNPHGWLRASFVCSITALTISVTAPLAHGASQTRWRLASPAQEPPARYGAGMAYDPGRARCVMLGGVDDNSRALTDAWEWDGTTWSRIPYPSSIGILDATLAHDPVGGGVIVVLFDNNGYGTWRWDGVAWTKVAAAAQTPPNQIGAVLSRADRSVIQFGGGALANPTNETWVWDGSSWRLAPVAVHPPERAYAHLTYDSQRRRVLLGGGQGGANLFTDTWAWDGRAWTVVNGGAAPAAWKMAYDEARDRVVKVGFGGGPGQGFPWGTYELDASSGWAPRMPSGAPAGRSEFALAHDTARGQTVMFGGFASGGASDETWIYEPVVAARFATTGPGCAGIAAPSLRATAPSSLPWLGRPFSVQVANAPGAGVMMVGNSISQWGAVPLPLDLTRFGITGCSLLVGPLASTAIGFGSVWTAQIPNAPGLLGQTFYLQALVAAPGANPAQLLVSGAGAAQVGGL